MCNKYRLFAKCMYFYYFWAFATWGVCILGILVKQDFYIPKIYICDRTWGKFLLLKIHIADIRVDALNAG